ncbi:MAG: hypothetical protein IKO41_08960 [Lachnospiraceae bacterium]|nr:hypothetical protein [Lachnospiraceae bacterium]
MKRSEVTFLIYARINDEFILKARRLKASEVTKTANEIQKRDKCDVLILEDVGQPEKTGKGSRGKALAAVRNMKTVGRACK